MGRPIVPQCQRFPAHSVGPDAAVWATPISARSNGVAIYIGDWAVAQVWVFWIAPIVGAVVGAALYRFVGGTRTT